MARYRLTESRLRDMIHEAVKSVLRENWEQEYWDQQPSKQMRSQILSNVLYYVNDNKGYKHLPQDVVSKYGFEDDALEDMANDDNVIRFINSNSQGHLRLSDYFGEHNLVSAGGNNVLYHTSYYYVTDIDPEGNANKIVVPKDEMRGISLKKGDGSIVLRFDRSLLREYFQQIENESNFENDPKYIEMKDEYYRQKEEKRENQRKAEEKQKQTIARNLANREPTSPERQKQIDDMWKEYRRNR